MSVKLIPEIHVMTSLRMRGVLPSLFHVSLWCVFQLRDKLTLLLTGSGHGLLLAIS